MTRNCAECPTFIEHFGCGFPLMKPVHDEYCEGIMAHKNGLTREDCPYPKDEEKKCGNDTRLQQWYAGFTYAEMEDEEN
jgi:hypothetical protein